MATPPGAVARTNNSGANATRLASATKGQVPTELNAEEYASHIFNLKLAQRSNNKGLGASVVALAGTALIDIYFGASKLTAAVSDMIAGQSVPVPSEVLAVATAASSVATLAFLLKHRSTSRQESRIYDEASRDIKRNARVMGYDLLERRRLAREFRDAIRREVRKSIVAAKEGGLKLDRDVAADYARVKAENRGDGFQGLRDMVKITVAGTGAFIVGIIAVALEAPSNTTYMEVAVGGAALLGTVALLTTIVAGGVILLRGANRQGQAPAPEARAQAATRNTDGSPNILSEPDDETEGVHIFEPAEA